MSESKGSSRGRGNARSCSRRRCARGVARLDRYPTPESAAALASLVREVFGISLASARAGACAGASGASSRGGPLEYLWHAFDERGGTEDEAARDAVVWACRGGGKTFLGALATLLDLAFKPGIQVRILAGSLEQAGRMHAHLRRLCDHPAVMPLVRGRPTRTRLMFKGGSMVELLAQSHTSVRGTRVHRLRCDEVELFDPEIWEAAQLVTISETLERGPVRGSVEALSTMHVPHGLMSRLVRECARGSRSLFRWGLADVMERCACAAKPEDAREACPLREECAGRGDGGEYVGGHVRVSDAIAMKKRVGLHVWRSEMLCLEPSRSDAVLPEFDPAVHVVDEVPGATLARGRWLGGLDFGLRTSVLLWAVTDRETGVLYVVDERVAHGELIADHARALRERQWPIPEWIGADPAGEAGNDQTGLSSVRALESHGFKVRTRRAAGPRVESGLALVRARLRGADGRVGLRVHARCLRLIESLTSYRYDRSRPHAERPVKDGSDHAVDALRYLVVQLDARGSCAVSRYAA